MEKRQNRKLLKSKDLNEVSPATGKNELSLKEKNEILDNEFHIYLNLDYT